MITLILTIAFAAAVAIAAYGLNSSARYEQWYETNDEWWEAFLDGKMEDINELLDFISDTEADWAMDMVRERYAYDKLFASYEVLQDEYLKLKSKQQQKCCGGRMEIKVAACQKHGLRYIHPTECERLQCFPDAWTEGVSNTQRYRQLGNAVNVEVVKHIMNELRRRSK